LERWEEIRRLVKVYDSMSSDEKTQNAVWFAWAFYRANDLEKVSHFVNRFPDAAMDPLALKVIFLIASEQYEMAAHCLEHCWRHLAKDCSIYSALNANQADENLAFAHNLIELEEALSIRRERGITVPQIWIRRLNGLSGDSYSWMRVVEIRNLAFTPSESMTSYRKLMNVLVKERRWALVDAFWGKMSDSIADPLVQIAYIKLLWARGRTRDAIDALHALNCLYEPRLPDDGETPATVRSGLLNEIVSKHSGDWALSAERSRAVARSGPRWDQSGDMSVDRTARQKSPHSGFFWTTATFDLRR
jgi:hypothetical protein